jgi:hypothetical protein
MTRSKQPFSGSGLARPVVVRPDYFIRVAFGKSSLQRRSAARLPGAATQDAGRPGNAVANSTGAIGGAEPYNASEGRGRDGTRSVRREDISAGIGSDFNSLGQNRTSFIEGPRGYRQSAVKSMYDDSARSARSYLQVPSRFQSRSPKQTGDPHYNNTDAGSFSSYSAANGDVGKFKTRSGVVPKIEYFGGNRAKIAESGNATSSSGSIVFPRLGGAWGRAAGNLGRDAQPEGRGLPLTSSNKPLDQGAPNSARNSGKEEPDAPIPSRLASRQSDFDGNSGGGVQDTTEGSGSPGGSSPTQSTKISGDLWLDTLSLQDWLTGYLDGQVGRIARATNTIESAFSSG